MALPFAEISLPEQAIWDGYPLGLGLVVEDKPSEFSCVQISSITVCYNLLRSILSAAEIYRIRTIYNNYIHIIYYESKGHDCNMSCTLSSRCSKITRLTLF